MSARRLREAAAVLRGAARAASRHGEYPWQPIRDNSWAAKEGVLDGQGHPICATAFQVSDEQARDTAVYIATMQPAVGLALADWLDAEAEDVWHASALRLAGLILGIEVQS